jgi:hypothetical protein
MSWRDRLRRRGNRGGRDTGTEADEFLERDEGIEDDWGRRTYPRERQVEGGLPGGTGPATDLAFRGDHADMAGRPAQQDYRVVADYPDTVYEQEAPSGRSAEVEDDHLRGQPAPYDDDLREPVQTREPDDAADLRAPEEWVQPAAWEARDRALPDVREVPQPYAGDETPAGQAYAPGPVEAERLALNWRDDLYRAPGPEREIPPIPPAGRAEPMAVAPDLVMPGPEDLTRYAPPPDVAPAEEVDDWRLRADEVRGEVAWEEPETEDDGASTRPGGWGRADELGREREMRIAASRYQRSDSADQDAEPSAQQARSRPKPPDRPGKTVKRTPRGGGKGGRGRR